MTRKERLKLWREIGRIRKEERSKIRDEISRVCGVQFASLSKTQMKLVALLLEVGPMYRANLSGQHYFVPPLVNLPSCRKSFAASLSRSVSRLIEKGIVLEDGRKKIRIAPFYLARLTKIDKHLAYNMLRSE